MRPDYQGALENVLAVKMSTTGNPAGGAETDLLNYSLRAGWMDFPNKVLLLHAWGSFAATAAGKTLRFYFGATSQEFGNALANEAGTWYLQAVIARETRNTQRALVITQLSPNSPPNTGALIAPVENLNGAVALRVTGAAANASDITLRLAIIRLLTPIETIL